MNKPSHKHRKKTPTPPSSPTLDVAKTLARNVEEEFKTTVDAIYQCPDEAYKTASKFVYAFGRYITSKKLTKILIKDLTKVMQNAFTDPKFEKRIASLLAFSDIWLRTRIDTKCIERNDGFVAILKRLYRATGEATREWASRVMCSLLWSLTRRSQDEEYKKRGPYCEISHETPYTGSRLWSRNNKISFLTEVLSYIEWTKFTQVPFEDFQKKSWSEPLKYPNRALLLRAFIERNNRMSDWVSSTVLAQRTPETRAKAFEVLTLLAKECLDQGNYNCASCIMSGLQNRAVERVKTLIPVRKDYIFLFNFVDNATRPTANYREYRRAQSARIASRKRFIPICSTILRDLTYIEDGNPDTKDGGTAINRDKISLIYFTNDIIHLASVIPYQFPISKVEPAHAYVLGVFEKLPRLSDSDLCALSGKIKPYPPDSSEEEGALVDSQSATRNTSQSISAPPQDAFDESSGLSAGDLIDLPLDLSSLNDKSFLLVGVPSGSINGNGESGSTSSRVSARGPDLSRQIKV
jgi:hypothetical protein